MVLECRWLPMTHVKETLTMITLQPSHALFFGSEVLLLGNIFPVNTGNNKTDGHSVHTNGAAVIIEHNFFLM